MSWATWTNISSPDTSSRRIAPPLAEEVKVLWRQGMRDAAKGRKEVLDSPVVLELEIIIGRHPLRVPSASRLRLRLRLRARPPATVFDRGHAFSDCVPSERERSSVPPSSNAARLWRAGGLHSSEAAPPPYLGSRRFRISGRVFLPPLGRDGRTAYPSLAPVGETHPEAQTADGSGVSSGLIRRRSP